ncbi:MAG: hypothetical protein ABI726_08050 [bacterium]
MSEKIKGVLAAMAALGALAIGGAAIAGAAGNGQSAPGSSAQPVTSESENDSDRNEADVAINGSALDQASAAALEHTGGGQVTETEVGDEESYYEVEVSQADGSQVDVQLDRGFAVVGSEADGQDD